MAESGAPQRRPFLLRLHLWLAVVAGLLIAFLGLSGSLVVFRAEVDRCYAVEPVVGGAVAGKAVAGEAAAGELIPHGAGLDRTAVAKRLTADGARIVRLQPDRDGLDVWTLRHEDAGWTAFTTVTPAGDVAAGADAGSTRGAALPRFLTLMAGLHHDLGAGAVGHWIVGSGGVVVLALLFTGWWSWWPGLRSAVATLRPWRRWTAAGARSRHLLTGIVATPVLLLATVTGVLYSFPDLRRGAHGLLGGEAATLPLPMRPTADQPKSQPRPDGARTLDWQRAVAAATAVAEDLAKQPANAGNDPVRILVVAPPRAPRQPRADSAMAAAPAPTAPTSPALAQGAEDGCWTASFAVPGTTGHANGLVAALDRWDGSVRGLADPRDGVATWVSGHLLDLHTGGWGSTTGRILHTIAGLVLVFLFVGGLLLWRRRLKRVA